MTENPSPDYTTEAAEKEQAIDGDTSGVIQITRPDSFTDHLREYKVFIDDKEAGSIKSKQSMSFPVAAGRRNVRIKIDWCKAELTVDVPSGGEVELHAGSNVTGWKRLAALYYVTLGASKYLYLKQV